MKSFLSIPASPYLLEYLTSDMLGVLTRIKIFVVEFQLIDFLNCVVYSHSVMKCYIYLFSPPSLFCMFAYVHFHVHAHGWLWVLMCMHPATIAFY